VHAADGGPTAAANLALVCPTHHRFVHEHGWHIQATRPGPTGSGSEDLMGAPTRSAGRRSIPACVPGSPPPRGHEPKTHQHHHRSLGATPQCRNRYPSGADRIGRLPREPGVSVWWRSHKDGDSPRPRDRVCATRALTASAGQASSRTRATG
jgi:hypothetical protein